MNQNSENSTQQSSEQQLQQNLQLHNALMHPYYQYQQYSNVTNPYLNVSPADPRLANAFYAGTAQYQYPAIQQQPQINYPHYPSTSQSPHQNVFSAPAVQYTPNIIQQQLQQQHLMYHNTPYQYQQQRQMTKFPYQAGPQQQQPKMKKPPVPCSCIPCGKTFDNERSYASHIQQHIKCDHCDYNAAKRLVIKHMNETHGDSPKPTDKSDKMGGEEGNIKWIRTMDSPEEIERWIAERKKNYPTDSNQTQRDGKRLTGKMAKQRFQEICNTFRLPEPKDAEKGIPREIQLSAKTPNINIDSLIDYDAESDKEEEDAAPEEISGKQLPPPSIGNPSKIKTRPCKYFARGKCNNGDSCTFKHDSNKRPADKKSSTAGNNQNVKRKRGDLYEMLLKKDTDKEAAIVCHAIRHLISIKNNSPDVILEEDKNDALVVEEEEESIDEIIKDLENHDSSSTDCSSVSSDSDVSSSSCSSSSDSEEEEDQELEEEKVL